MDSLIHFKNFYNEITQNNSRKYKLEVLEKYKDDSTIKKYLQIAFDPYKVYGISTKKLGKQLACANNYFANVHTVFELFEYLEVHNTGTLNEILECQNALNYVYSLSKPCGEVLQLLICKDLSIGCDAKTINSVIPGLIPTFNVQLANKYFDKPEYVEGKTFAITTKIDGGRIIALKENGQVSFYTRAGQKYEGLVDLEEEMSRLIPDNICLDGEITLLTRGSLSSKEAYKQTMKIVRQTTNPEKHGIKMQVFDCLTIEEFKTQCCDRNYTTRRADLKAIFEQIDFNYFELLPILYHGSDTSKITKILEEVVADGEEGIMINICDANYEFKRTNNLLKVKKFNSADLRIIGFEEGTGKYVGKLGALVCDYKGGEVKVGSGLTDEQREEIWQNRSDYINTIIEIAYFEETTDSTGKPSLRFPTFKDFRPDKIEPNY